MSNLLDRVFAEVCLDERVSDGIFKMDEATHMDALREFFLKRGLSQEAAIHVTNRMIEGKYPERQAYNKDGILVTFPTPQHKARAISRGTHFEKNPVPQANRPAQAEEPKKAPAGSKPEPGELPADDDSKGDGGEDDEEGDDEKGSSGGDDGEKQPTIFQGDKQLAVEPPRGEDKPEPPPQPPSPTVPPAPRTPQRVAAEKEVTRQIFATDDTSLGNVANPLSTKLNPSAINELRELYKKADELGYREAVKFLTPYVKP